MILILIRLYPPEIKKSTVNWKYYDSKGALHAELSPGAYFTHFSRRNNKCSQCEVNPGASFYM